MCEEYISVRRDAVEWLKKHYPALCEKSGLCERVAGRLYTRTTSHHTGDCPEALFAQAPEIADEAMTELLREHAKCADEHGVMWGLCDADGDDVATLAEADAPLVEAVKWLQKRKLCELVESPHGATVLLFSAMGGATR